MTSSISLITILRRTTTTTSPALRISKKRFFPAPPSDYHPIPPKSIPAILVRLGIGILRITKPIPVVSGSFDSFEPGRVTLEKDRSAVVPTLVSEIDLTMKKCADNLMHALDSVSARLTQLESRTCHLDNSVDELKVFVGTNQGSSDGRMRQLENILREVQNGVQFIRDKQEIMDAEQHLAKLQISKVEQHADIKGTERVDSSQPALSIG